MDNAAIFIATIREYLERENITVNQFSKHIGVAERAVAKRLTGEYMPAIDSAIKVAKLLNCSLDYLFGLSETPEYNKTSSNENYAD